MHQVLLTCTDNHAVKQLTYQMRGTWSFEFAALASLQLWCAGLFTDSIDTLRSCLAQPNYMEVSWHCFLKCLDVIKI